MTGLADDPAQACGDVVHARLSSGDGDHEVVHVVIGRAAHVDAVQLEEHRGGEPAQPLVAVDEGMAVDQRLQKRPGLGPDIGVRVLAECTRAGTRGSSIEQSEVADRGRVAEEDDGEAEQILDAEVLDVSDRAARSRRRAPS